MIIFIQLMFQYSFINTISFHSKKIIVREVNFNTLGQINWSINNDSEYNNIKTNEINSNKNIERNTIIDKRNSIIDKRNTIINKRNTIIDNKYTNKIGEKIKEIIVTPFTTTNTTNVTETIKEVLNNTMELSFFQESIILHEYNKTIEYGIRFIADMLDIFFLKCDFYSLININKTKIIISTKFQPKNINDLIDLYIYTRNNYKRDTPNLFTTNVINLTKKKENKKDNENKSIILPKLLKKHFENVYNLLIDKRFPNNKIINLINISSLKDMKNYIFNILNFKNEKLKDLKFSTDFSCKCCNKTNIKVSIKTNKESFISLIKEYRIIFNKKLLTKLSKDLTLRFNCKICKEIENKIKTKRKLNNINDIIIEFKHSSKTIYYYIERNGKQFLERELFELFEFLNIKKGFKELIQHVGLINFKLINEKYKKEYRKNLLTLFIENSIFYYKNINFSINKYNLSSTFNSELIKCFNDFIKETNNPKLFTNLFLAKNINEEFDIISNYIKSGNLLVSELKEQYKFLCPSCIIESSFKIKQSSNKLIIIFKEQRKLFSIKINSSINKIIK